MTRPMASQSRTMTQERSGLDEGFREGLLDRFHSAVPGHLFGDDARMKILKNKRYQELLIAEQRVKDLELALRAVESAEIQGEALQREWDRTLGRGIRSDYQ